MSEPLTLMIQPTDRMVDVGGEPARVWEGCTSDHQHVICVISLVAVHPDADQSAFQQRLREVRPATPTARAIDLRVIN